MMLVAKILMDVCSFKHLKTNIMIIETLQLKTLLVIFVLYSMMQLFGKTLRSLDLIESLYRLPFSSSCYRWFEKSSFYRLVGKLKSVNKLKSNCKNHENFYYFAHMFTLYERHLLVSLLWTSKQFATNHLAFQVIFCVVSEIFIEFQLNVFFCNIFFIC